MNAATDCRPAAEMPLAYVIVPPGLRASKAWPALWARIAKGVRNANPVTFDALFASPAAYAAHWREVEPTLAGAVVVCQRRGGRYLLGRTALDEARHLRALGKPVLVLGPRGFVFWQSVEVRETAELGPFIAAEILLPAASTAASVTTPAVPSVGPR